MAAQGTLYAMGHIACCLCSWLGPLSFVLTVEDKLQGWYGLAVAISMHVIALVCG